MKDVSVSNVYDGGFDISTYSSVRLDALIIPNQADRDLFNGTVDNTAPGHIPPITPSTYDVKTAAQKGLAGDSQFNERFFIIQAQYRILLEEFLATALNLSQYDNLMQDSALDYVVQDNERMSYYQRYSTMDLKYIYLRNNLYIERLPEETLALFDNYLAQDNSVTKETLSTIVSQTYPIIITPYDENYLREHKLTEDKVVALYDGDGSKSAPNRSLVFGIDFSAEGNEEYYEQRFDYVIEDIIPDMENALRMDGGTPIKVFLG